MFGMPHKLEDATLYLVYDMVGRLLEQAKLSFENIDTTDIDAKTDLLTKIVWWKKEMDEFESDIKEQAKNRFQFCVEELYNLYGQYDEYIHIEFHRFSASAQKYGNSLGGILQYGRTERAGLEASIAAPLMSRTNGLVKIKVAGNEALTIEQKKQLLSSGFLSGDIHKVTAANIPSAKAYAQSGLKEMPNTINVEFNATQLDHGLLMLRLFRQRFDMGGKLIAAEWEQMLGYQLYHTPDMKDDEQIKPLIYNQDGSLKQQVRFYQLSAAMYSKNFPIEDKVEFSAMLKQRRLLRFDVLQNELEKTNIHSVEEFKLKHPGIYDEIYKNAVMFEDAAITGSPVPIAVYWDFRSFLHIYLRHCAELQPDGAFKSKTPFSYKQDDISRILKKAVEQLEDQIQARLEEGKDFRTFGEKSLYFNGNYYQLRIEATGRVDSFFPYE